MNCNCPIHRNDAVHVYQGRIIEHEAIDDEIARGANPAEIRTFESGLYMHGMSAEDLLAASLEPACAISKYAEASR